MSLVLFLLTVALGSLIQLLMASGLFNLIAVDGMFYFPTVDKIQPIFDLSCGWSGVDGWLNPTFLDLFSCKLCLLLLMGVTIKSCL